MGVGMSVVVPEKEVEAALSILHDAGENAYVIGKIERGAEKIRIC